MEEMKKNQTENENMPAPKSLKKVNKNTIVMAVLVLILLFISDIFGTHTPIGSIAVIVAFILAIIAVVLKVKNRIQK